MKSKYSFWELINESEIEIPVIQRDYAQGRKDERVDEIRENFVADIVESLRSPKEEPLSLDFVYGKSFDRLDIEEREREKENIERILLTIKEYSNKVNYDINYAINETQEHEFHDRVLIPLDGQQRLTTLFLVHFYVGVCLNKNISVLKKFKYKTRKSSSSFCSSIIENAQEISNHQGLITEFISNQRWFYTTWKKDPTVSGMLNMLAQIELELSSSSKEELNVIWENLTLKHRIVFDFFDLRKEGLEDELYVKMNARGKPLTDFENFKAWLQKKEKNEDYGFDWGRKMDKDWIDVIWRSTKNVKTIDDKFLQLFKNLSSIQKSLQFKLRDDKLVKADKELSKRLGEDKFISTSFYKEQNVFDGKTLTYIFKILEILSQKEAATKLDNEIAQIWVESFDGKPFSQQLILDYNSLNLFHRTFLFSILSFLIKKEKTIMTWSDEELKNFGDWLRISRNLIYNSRIDDEVPFVKAIQAIEVLGDNILDIERHLSVNVGDNGSNGKWIGYFSQVQQKEEWIKANFLNKDWLESIKRAENHFYFYGQVEFILNLSKSEDNTYNLGKFKEYLTKLENLFTLTNLEGTDFIIQKALLCTSNFDAHWMKSYSSSRYSFYNSKKSNSRQRDEDWRDLFKDSPKKLLELKVLLDSCDCTRESLLALIDDKKSQINDWRRLFIENPKLIEVCSQRLINWTSNNFVRLLGASRLSHYHKELRSYALFLTIQRKFNLTDDNYREVKRGSKTPYFVFKIDGVEYRVKFSANESKFKYKVEGVSDYTDIDSNLPIYSEVMEFKTYCI